MSAADDDSKISAYLRYHWVKILFLVKDILAELKFWKIWIDKFSINGKWSGSFLKFHNLI